MSSPPPSHEEDLDEEEIEHHIMQRIEDFNDERRALIKTIELQMVFNELEERVFCQMRPMRETDAIYAEFLRLAEPHLGNSAFFNMYNGRLLMSATYACFERVKMWLINNVAKLDWRDTLQKLYNESWQRVPTKSLFYDTVSKWCGESDVRRYANAPLHYALLRWNKVNLLADYVSRVRPVDDLWDFHQHLLEWGNSVSTYTNGMPAPLSVRRYLLAKAASHPGCGDMDRLKGREEKTEFESFVYSEFVVRMAAQLYVALPVLDVVDRIVSHLVVNKTSDAS